MSAIASPSGGRLIGAGAAAELRAGAAEHRADAVFGHADDVADFLVRLAFEMIHPHDGRLGAAQLAEQAVELVVIADALLEIGVFGGGLRAPCRSAARRTGRRPVCGPPRGGR